MKKLRKSMLVGVMLCLGSTSFAGLGAAQTQDTQHAAAWAAMTPLAKTKQPTAPAKKSKFKVVAGKGKYAGYSLLKGHPDEKKYNIYFKGNASSYSVIIEDLRGIDLNETIKWKYKGKTRKNTRKELYGFFADTSRLSKSLGMHDYTLTPQWFKDTFGKTYTDWTVGIGYSADAERWVSEYFEETQPSTGSKITLKPDTVFVEPKPKPKEVNMEQLMRI
ncbi:hypothetical protein EBB07_22045 [Paenibacillaceae bacterium]|nr:hypothetical protein EBB07_22045 [Paenibacillaceae bacterium]